MKGFTFIEIMVTTAIAIFLFTGVISAYNTFTESSRLRQAALNLKNDLRAAQNKAISGEKPINLRALGVTCDELVGYQITFINELQANGAMLGKYTVKAKCNPDQPQASETTFTLPQSVSFDTVPDPLVFRVLTRGVDTNTDIKITLKSGGKTYLLTVSPQGDITDGGIK